MMKLKNGFNYSKMGYGVNNKAEHTTKAIRNAGDGGENEDNSDK